jgi:hypothetical protein
VNLLRQVFGWQSLKEMFTTDWLTTLLFVCWMASFLTLAVGWLGTGRLYWLAFIPIGLGFQALTLWRAHWYEREHQI